MPLSCKNLPRQMWIRVLSMVVAMAVQVPRSVFLDCSSQLLLAMPFYQNRCSQRNAAAIVLATAETTDSSAKERRRHRNERREELAASRRLVKDQIDDKFLAKAREKKTDPSLRKLAKLGMQWYVLRVFKGREAQAADALRSALAIDLPTTEFEVFCPMMPVEKSSRGKTRQSMQAIFDSHIFLRCVLERDVHNSVLQEPAVFSFAGSFPQKMKDGYDATMLRGGYCDVYLPTPVPGYQIEAMRAEVKKKEEEFKLLQSRKEAAKHQQIAAEKQAGAVQRHDSEKSGGVLGLPNANAGDAVVVTSGPYQNFQGTMSEFPSVGKVKVLLSVFGQDTEIEVGMDDITLVNN